MKNPILKPLIIGFLISCVFFACKTESGQHTMTRSSAMEVDYMVIKPQGISHSIHVSGSLLPA